jgi:DNA-binding NarL/FixJ family response regulator
MQRTFQWEASGLPDNRLTNEERLIGDAAQPDRQHSRAQAYGEEQFDRELDAADRPEPAPEKLGAAVALIDPKALTDDSIGELLATAFPDCAMVAASTCEELLETEGVCGPRLVVIYIRSEALTVTWVQSTLALLRTRLPEASAVVLADEDGVDVSQALAQGARGYIPTSVGREVAIAALRLVGAGGTFIPADSFRSTAAKMDDRPELGRKRSDGPDLTPRELSVIDLLREGKSNKLIARQLDIQESTVKVHVSNILKKLNAANRTHAAFVANRLLGQDAEPVALRENNQAQSGGMPNR